MVKRSVCGVGGVGVGGRCDDVGMVDDAVAVVGGVRLWQ